MPLTRPPPSPPLFTASAAVSGANAGLRRHLPLPLPLPLRGCWSNPSLGEVFPSGRGASRGSLVRCMANQRRVKMVAKQISRELSDMLLTDKVLQYAVLPEASLGADRYLSSLTTISDVEVSGDLQVVKVYVSVFGDERGREVAIAGLKSKAKYVRSELGRRMKLRITPEVRFMEDESLERGSREPKYFDIDASQMIRWLKKKSTLTIPVVLKKTIILNWNRRHCWFKQSIPDSAIWREFKFILLIILLTFPTSSDAVAGAEITLMNSVPFIGDLGDITTGFASAFLLIFFSELGDKTFFIAVNIYLAIAMLNSNLNAEDKALLAARSSATVVYLGTFTALAAMSVISVIFGRMFHYVDDILPFRLGETDFPIDDFAAVCLLVYFGVTTLLEATSDDQKSKEEQKEAELVLSEFSGNGAGITAAASTAVSTFVLVFVAEWGDKSFFSTIALAASSSPLGVIAGALAGHALATLLAVIGGSLLGNFLSEKVIAYIGGVLFLFFATVTLIEIFN